MAFFRSMLKALLAPAESKIHKKDKLDAIHETQQNKANLAEGFFRNEADALEALKKDKAGYAMFVVTNNNHITIIDKGSNSPSQLQNTNYYLVKDKKTQKWALLNWGTFHATIWDTKKKDSGYAKIDRLSILDIKSIAELLQKEVPVSGLKFTAERLITPSTNSAIAIRKELNAIPEYKHAATR